MFISHVRIFSDKESKTVLSENKDVVPHTTHLRELPKKKAKGKKYISFSYLSGLFAYKYTSKRLPSDIRT